MPQHNVIHFYIISPIRNSRTHVLWAYNAIIMLKFEVLIAVAVNFIDLWEVKHHVVRYKPIYMASHPRCW